VPEMSSAPSLIHSLRLVLPSLVKPFVKLNKSNFLDAEAIAEAVDRQNMWLVPIKTDDQLDLQAMHRSRDRLVARRTVDGLLNSRSVSKISGVEPYPQLPAVWQGSQLIDHGRLLSV
jgi:transposase